MSRYLVTGGSGRLGRSVVAVLAGAGHEVISVDREPRAAGTERSIACDLSDANATAELFAEVRPDAVVHLAGIAIPFGRPDPELYAINTGLAFSVLEASLTSGVSSLLFASSPTVIGYGAPDGWQPAYLPIDEQHPLAPWNAYALAKQAVEGLVAMVVRAHGDRLRIGAFRPCYVITPEEWAGAPTQQGHTVIERLDRPELSAVALFNYVDARDVGEFVLAWIDRAHEIPNGATFFVGASDSLAREPITDLFPRYRPELVEAAGALAVHAPIFSSERAERLLGWRASRTWRTELAREDVS
ncbi:NAD-dependent epimerase/dehydratase family protein [Lacisediminihabitans profunda]|uniref:NAD(P)-dependent oxidoreductase n=1 Tax=Lacisediminihabitans profunda TaxID=2594790 RepID=A0A5C8USP7_9MICO|nr:NAD(P)-dependent oxidoreductase [Lacisediminihabitans profunda]TXN30910.1 NAD(P)-dependent oxidoreductase [Lacisediminihabitans profunda]